MGLKPGLGINRCSLDKPGLFGLAKYRVFNLTAEVVTVIDM